MGDHILKNMVLQFPTECLNRIFECLEEGKCSLHSCLLINRLWCKISVRILWRDVWVTRDNVH
jgi:hypothetical protein